MEGYAGQQFPVSSASSRSVVVRVTVPPKCGIQVPVAGLFCLTHLARWPRSFRHSSSSGPAHRSGRHVREQLVIGSQIGCWFLESHDATAGPVVGGGVEHGAGVRQVLCPTANPTNDG